MADKTVLTLTLAEQETLIYQNASDRTIWYVYSDDAVRQRQMEKLGLELVKEEASGGKHYRLPDNQLTLRRKRVLTEKQRQKLSERAKKNFGR